MKEHPEKVLPCVAPLAFRGRRDYLIISSVANLVPLNARPRASLEFIAFVVAEEYGLSVNDLQTHRKTWPLIIPRHVFCYLAMELTTHSYPGVGRFLGGRDHTTILYCHKKISRLIKSDNALRDKVNLLRAKLEGVRGGQ